MTKKVSKYLAAILLILLLLIGSTLYVFTKTDWGRDRVRILAVSQLRKAVNGEVEVAEVHGDLLKGLTLVDVSIRDSLGEPFVSLDTLKTAYGIRNFLNKRIVLNNVRVVNPVVVLDKKPGELWNYERIFRLDTAPGEPSAPGFGSWIQLNNVTVVNGSITTKIPWGPDEQLSDYERDSVIKAALSPSGRMNIVEVANGYQNISLFTEISGSLPYLRIADPDQPGQVFDASGLSLVAQPFRPPTVRIVSATGRFTILNDSLYFKEAGIRLTDSKLVGSGRYNLANDDLRLRIHADPVATNDLLWIDPNIPRDGKGALNFALDWVGTNNSYAATDIDFAVAGATVAGAFGLLMNEDSLTFENTDLRFNRVDTRTIEQLFPTIISPVQGYLTGAAKVDGGFNLMRLDADIAFDDPKSGRSKIRANGYLGLPDDFIQTRDLKLDLQQVQVGLAKHFSPELPVFGFISGNATLNGATNRRLNIVTNLIHHDSTSANSEVSGTVAVGGGQNPLINADLELKPLSLLMAGRFAPAADLRGTLAGPVRLTGPMDNLVLDAQLSTPDGGTLSVIGSGSFKDSTATYDVNAVAALFDGSAISEKSPSTSISADMSLKGEGLKPETMNAALKAHFKASVYDSVNVDSAAISAFTNNGLLTVDTFQVRLPHAKVDMNGTFGLSNEHSGALSYSAEIDSLGMLSRFIPRDTGSVQIRPGVAARILEQARADSARRYNETEVERAVTGAPGPKLVVDTPTAIRRDDLRGFVRTSGVLTGNIHNIGVNGEADGSDIIALGSSVKLFSAKYSAANILTPDPNFDASIIASKVIASGFAIDTVTAGITHRNPDGSLSVKLVQPDSAIYSASASYSLLDGLKSVFVDNTEIRFDSALYKATKATIVEFDTTGINIDAFEVAGPNNSLIYADAFLPKKGDAILHVRVTDFDVANIISLTQTDAAAKGLITFDVTAEGTVADPKLRATFTAKEFAFNAMPIPEVSGEVEYAKENLKTRVLAKQNNGSVILEAVGDVPINLALTAVEGSRVPENREIDVSIFADSLPLDVIPEIEDVITNMSGNAEAKFSVKGTVARPDVQGFLSLSNGKMKLVSNGVTYTKMNGMIRLIRDTLIVDSLYAEGNGFVRASGGIGLKKLSEPSFDLALTASNLQVLNNDYGKVHADAKLEMNGPITGVSISGNARVREGYVYVPETAGKTLIGSDDPVLYDVLDTTIAKNRALFPTVSPLVSNLQVNVYLGVDRDFFVRTKEANVELYTEDDIVITLDQTKNLLQLDGMLLSDRGEYRFQGKRFAVKRGTALFANTTELDPTLQITAEYEVQFASREAIAIQILIGGTLGAPKITLTSDAQPPISQTDLLSYLAFGQSSSSLMQIGGNGLTTGGSGGSNIVGQGAAFATKQVTAAALGAVTDEIAGEAARSLGADVLTIAPAPVSLDAASVLRGTEIQFGKYFENRTFLSLQVRPDPESLKRPGFQVSHLFSLKKGYKAEATFEPRYLPREASLSKDRVPITTSVFGLFFIREWRF